MVINNFKVNLDLPYQSLVALDSDCVAYIDTGYLPTNNKTRVNFKYRVLKRGGSDRWFGSQGSSANLCFFVPWPGSNGPTSLLAHGNSSSFSLFNTPTAVGVDYIMDLTQESNKLNGVFCGRTVTNQAYTGNVTNGLTAFIFASNRGTPNLGFARVYYCQIWENDVLKRDFIPVMTMRTVPASKDSQGVERPPLTLGMWDKVEDKFYANKNTTGAFTAVWS